MHAAFQRYLVVVHVDIDFLRIQPRLALEGRLDLLFNVNHLDAWLDGNVVDDPLDTQQISNGGFRGALLISEFYLAAQRDPSMPYNRLDIGRKKRDIPFQSIDGGTGNVGIASLAHGGNFHLNVIGNRANSAHTFRNVFRGPTVRIMRNTPHQRYYAVPHLHAYCAFIEAGVPLHLVLYVALNFCVGFHIYFLIVTIITFTRSGRTPSPDALRAT